MAENKSNKQYFERAFSKSLTNFGHTTLKEQRKLVVDSQDVLPTGFAGKSLIFNIRSYRRCFLSYIAFFVVRLRISLLLLLAR
jgi:type III secretory pathway component EscR